MFKNEKNKIFSEVAIESGMNPASVRKLYYSMIRVMAKNLKKSGEFTLPDWGTFKIIDNLNHQVPGPNGMVTCHSRKVAFKIDYKLRNYVKNW